MKRWYVIHTYVGSEEKVKRNLEQRIKSLDAQDKIFRIIIPTEPEIEVREGQKRIVHKKILPGYLLVEMIMDDKSWNVVRRTPGVTGFVGREEKGGRFVPVPLEEEKVQAILQRMETTTPRIKVGFEKGETVKIISGPFADFVGTVDEIYPEKGKIRLIVSFFGRETPIELDMLEVARI